MEKHKYVIYVGLKYINADEKEEYLITVKDSFQNLIMENINNNEYIFIPDMESNKINIECVNPIYITNERLINLHEDRLKKLDNNIKKLIYGKKD